MTIDKTLKVKAGLIKVRNVLTRGERLEKLKEAEKFGSGASPLGLPKVRVMKLSLKKKKKVKKEEGEAGAAGATPAAAPTKKAAKKA
jgi:small basic protein (TIGR04137 family)